MKFQYVLSILLLITIPAFAQTKKAKDIETLTQQWVNANNAQDMEKISSLYAPLLNFYAINKDKATCIKEKQSFFAKYPKYSISISNLDIDFYKSGIIRCNFVKSEVWNDEARSPQQAYLLFEKEGNSYHIIAESDSRMDAQRGYSPQLGKKVQKSSNITYMLIGAVVLLVLASIFLLVRKNKEQKKKLESIPMLFDNSANAEIGIKLPEFTIEELKRNNGLAFEQFVVKNFDRNYFKLLHWRGDKYIDGHYPLSSMDPDLDYMYRDSTRQECFAIECKWRQDFINNTITLAEERQLMNYRNYQSNVKYPVFIVLGVGGTASMPYEIFIIPLTEISSPVITKMWATKYKRKRTGQFFLKMPAMNLE